MKILVFFDLPVKQAKDRKAYTSFRKFLINDGYHMLQYSIYYRTCNGYDMVSRHMTRLENNLPSKGSVRAISVTEKQYSRMKVMVGKQEKHELKNESKQLTFF